MKNTALAKKVKELRSLKGWSQEELADKAKLSLRTVQRIEGGETIPRGHTLQQLSEVLNTPAEDLTATGIATNKPWLLILHISALTFMMFPLLGPLMPFLLWKTNPDKTRGMETIVRRLINFELAWCITQFVAFTAFLLSKINHLVVTEWLGYLFICMYLINVLLIAFLIVIAYGPEILGKKSFEVIG